MTELLIRRRSDRYLIALFALIGGVIGSLLFLVFSDPENLVMCSVTEFNQPPLQRSVAILTVTIFRRFTYTRTAATASAFDAEILFWGIAPLALSGLLGALLGGFAGYTAGRWLPRASF